MRLDIQQLLAEGGGTLDFSFSFPISDIPDLENGSCTVVGALHNHGGYMELVAESFVRGDGVCARCGTRFPYTLTIKTSRPVAKQLAGDAEEDYILADEDGFLSLLPIFEEELFIGFPSKLLCKEDCKGLCMKCGANLNLVNCGCVLKEIDPRLEVLKALLDNG